MRNRLQTSSMNSQSSIAAEVWPDTRRVIHLRSASGGVTSVTGPVQNESGRAEMGVSTDPREQCACERIRRICDGSHGTGNANAFHGFARCRCQMKSSGDVNLMLMLRWLAPCDLRVRKMLTSPPV